MISFSFLEKFIKQVRSPKLVTTNGIKKTLGSLLIFTSVFGMSGVVTHAEAPSPTDVIVSDDGVYTPADRAEVLQRLAIEIREMAYEKEEILWLARLLYSETKSSTEMVDIAWVIRNRVETGHRCHNPKTGKCDYQGAALSPSQFSGMHPRLDRNAYTNLAMDYSVVGVPAWDEALRVADQVYHSDGSDRTLAQNVTHFYSPTVVAAPTWSLPEHSEEVRRYASGRFAFYALY